MCEGINFSKVLCRIYVGNLPQKATIYFIRQVANVLMPFNLSVCFKNMSIDNLPRFAPA